MSCPAVFRRHQTRSLGSVHTGLEKVCHVDVQFHVWQIRTVGPARASFQFCRRRIDLCTASFVGPDRLCRTASYRDCPGDTPSAPPLAPASSAGQPERAGDRAARTATAGGRCDDAGAGPERGGGGATRPCVAAGQCRAERLPTALPTPGRWLCHRLQPAGDGRPQRFQGNRRGNEDPASTNPCRADAHKLTPVRIILTWPVARLDTLQRRI